MMVLSPIFVRPSSKINYVNRIQVNQVGWDALSPTKLSDDPVNLVKFHNRKTYMRNQCLTYGRNIYDD